MRKNRLTDGQKNMILVISGSAAKRVCVPVLFQSEQNIVRSLVNKGLARYEGFGDKVYFAYLTARGEATNV